MESALDTYIQAKIKDGTMSIPEAKALKDAFRRHVDLIQVPTIDRTKAVNDLPGGAAPTLLPPMLPRKRKKDDEP